ncbi:MAG: hypothetical protein QXO78_01690 [Desulfurococcaceae archaeon]|uniref:Uncharacterized protein n=1 Tax=Staphylothermus marinus TaxID=2280 RepID=A0A7C4H9J5_STAMA
MSEKTGLSKNLREFFLALLAILPSRNRVIQILRLLYETGGIDITSFRQMFRGVVDPHVDEVLGKLGVYIDKDTVKLKYMSLGWIIADLYNDIFDFLNNDDFRRKVSEASGLDIPDPLEEWIYIKLDTAFKDPVHGENAKIVMKELLNKTSITINELIEKGLNVGEAYVIGDVLKTLGLAEHIDGIIRLSPQLIENRDVLERNLKRMGIS